MGRRKVKILEQVEITDIAEKGRGVGRDATGRVVFVKDTAPGDIVDVRVVKKKKGFMQGVPLQFHKYSEQRVEPFCEHYHQCGGCQWQHLAYETQVQYKENLVRNALQRIGKVEVDEFRPILAAKENRYYRNKLEFSFSNKRWLDAGQLNDESITNKVDVLGFHPPGAFDKVVDVTHCWLQPDPSNELRNGIREIAKEQGLPFFDARENVGFMRQVMFRITTLGQVLVVVSFGADDQEKRERFLDALLERFPNIHSLSYCINEKLNDFMFDLDMIPYHGPSFVQEQLGHVTFKVGPKSFFQTNTRQAKELYDVVAEFAGLDGTQTVYDLYTGVGSIALYLAKDARYVVGIEEIPEAIQDAEENALLNNIDNCKFYAGDVKDVLSPEFAQRHGSPDVVITDPPRAGMHAKAVEFLRQLRAPRIVYVSCNPATQARDLALLNDLYAVRKAQPVDLFPHTHHMENVVELELRV
jgi:23S rRNA (uracil1939-C5)-methyltransferase